MNFPKKSQDNEDDFKKKYNEHKILYSSKIFFSFIFFFFFFCYETSRTIELNNNYEIFFPKYYDKSEEIKYADKFYHFCQNGTLFNKIRERRRKEPKLSIIIPIYNNENDIKKILTSIENQSYKNIEIIIVDDASNDDSIKLIQEYQRKDKRIKVIKHKTNQGLFVTRNDGVINSNGEYILFIEPNGLLSEGSLRKMYGAIEIFGADIIRFDTFYKFKDSFDKNDLDDLFIKEKVIYQPNILEQSFYKYKGELFQNNLYLWGKIIKRKLYQKILKNFSKLFMEKKWNLYEDSAIDFLLLKNAESYIFLNENGYINISDEENDKNNNKKSSEEANKDINNLFLLAQFFYEFTEDNIYEKMMAMYQIKRLVSDYKNSLELVNKDFDYYYSILSKYSDCKFILPQQKIYVNQLVEILKKQQKKSLI